MSTITSLKLWKDVGYTEGSAETPMLTDVLPTADFIFETVGTTEYKLVPSKDRLFSQFKVTMDYSDAIQCKYLQISLEMNNGDDLTFYGWIDGVSLLSDTENYSMCQIDWHIDFWRTYMNTVTFERGLVLRRPSGTSNPPQNPPFIKHKVGNSAVTDLLDQWHDMWWVIFTFTQEDDLGEITSTRVGAFPVWTKHDSDPLADSIGTFVDSQIRYFPTLTDVIRGSWDEDLGLTPSRILSAFLSPVPPADFTYTEHTASEPVKVSSLHSWSAASSHGALQHSVYCCFVATPEEIISPDRVDSVYYEKTKTLNDTSARTDDVKTSVLTGFQGESIGSIPFGVKLKEVKYRLVVSSVSAYIQLRFVDSDTAYNDVNAAQRNLQFSIPLITIDIGENSFSEYNYTGARSHDKAQMEESTRYSKETERVDAITSIATGAAGMAAGGAIAGGLGAAFSSGGLFGGVSSLVGQGVHNVLNLETNHNSNVDRINAEYYARMSDGLIMSGEGFDAIFYGRLPSLVKVEIDDYSQQRFSNSIANEGYKVNESLSSCQSLIEAGGPLQIDNLNITGNAPIEAIQYIKSRMKRGVKLV